jgi:4-amino-4-deoxy-L-arabinose transferase-like glycosyltransferase
MLLAFFLRFYKLGQVPMGLYQDETAIGYNAFSIMQTGMDEYGEKMPVYFKSFGDYKLPVYIYASIIPIRLFGLNEYSVRFISAFFGFLTVLVAYFLVYELAKSKKLAFVTILMMAVNPWHLHYSRATFEVSLVLFFYVLGYFLLLKSFFGNKRFVFFAGTLCFILSFYSYNLTRLLSPLIYILIIILNIKSLKNISKNEIFFTIFLSFAAFSPFVFTFFESGGFTSAKGTIIFTSAQIRAQILEFRSYIITIPIVFSKIIFNNLFLTIWQYIKNIISYFSVEFFFLNGSSHGNHGIGNVGLFYVIEIPLIILGAYKILKEKIWYGYTIFGWVAITIFVASLTREAPHATRSFVLIFPYCLLSAAGMSWAIRCIDRKLSKKYKGFIIITFCLLAGFNILYYFISYYFIFPVKYAPAWRGSDRDISFFLAQRQNDFDEIIIDRKANFPYTSYLFYNQFDPLEFQKTQIRKGPDNEGFDEINSFGKIKYENLNWEEIMSLRGRKLVVVSSGNSNQKLNPIKTFYYQKRPVVVASKETILSYPVQDIAYLVYEIK